MALIILFFACILIEEWANITLNYYEEVLFNGGPLSYADLNC